MAKIDIDLTTFVATGPAETYSKYTPEKREPGTVQVLIGSQIFVGEAHRYPDGRVYVQGFIGRYRTSANPWKASVSKKPGQEGLQVFFGRDDRSGRFNKQQGLSWEPELYAQL